MAATPNPYSPPKAQVEDVTPVTAEADKARREHIEHEAAVRSTGLLGYTFGGLMSFFGFLLTSGALLGVMGRSTLRFGVAYLAIGTLLLFVARGLRVLRPWARISTILMASIGMFVFPVGTVIGGYILYLMLASKGKRVFADDYSAVIAATPHLRYRTSIIVWIAVGLLLLAILGVIVIATFETMH